MAHGDIKPENIVLDDDGHIRLIDFALCRVVVGNRLCFFVVC